MKKEKGFLEIYINPQQPGFGRALKDWRCE